MQSRTDVCLTCKREEEFEKFLLGKKNKNNERECEREAEFTGEGRGTRVEVYQSLFSLSFAKAGNELRKRK
jgi:hypothetical protein